MCWCSRHPTPVFFYFTPNITSIFRTSNDGQSWINVGTYYCEGGFYFTNSFTGYACGTSGIEKTTNGGYNWFSVLNTNNVYGIHFSNDNTGFVTGHNGIIRLTVYLSAWSVISRV